jgi:hypothetical protein
VAIVQGGGVIFTALPINEVRYGGKTVEGTWSQDQEANETGYSESFDLKGMGIYNFIGVNVNGLTYLRGDRAIYDKSTGMMTLRGIRTFEGDHLTVIFNKVYENGESQVALSVPFDAKSMAPQVMGDYLTDPSNYKETYSLADHPIKSFVGITVDTVFYCHPSAVSFNAVNKTVTVTGLKLGLGNNITLVYNTER